MTLRSRKLKPIALARWCEEQKAQAHLHVINNSMASLTKAEALFSELLANPNAEDTAELAQIVAYKEKVFDSREAMNKQPKKKREHPFQKR